MKLITEPDFVRKSKEQFIVPEDTKQDLEDKYRYLMTYLDDIKMYSVSHKINHKIEEAEHGRPYMNLKHETRVMNSRKFTSLCHEIRFIENECTRLLNEINA